MKRTCLKKFSDAQGNDYKAGEFHLTTKKQIINR
jgi:hypothetical protein